MLQYNPEWRMTFEELDEVIDATNIYKSYRGIESKVKEFEKRSNGYQLTNKDDKEIIYMKRFKKAEMLQIYRKAGNEDCKCFCKCLIL